MVETNNDSIEGSKQERNVVIRLFKLMEKRTENQLRVSMQIASFFEILNERSHYFSNKI